jgi:ATP-binding cassette subfamily B protein
MSALPASASPAGGVQVRSRARLWRDILALLKELWLAQPLAWLSTVALLILGNARTGLYITAMGGVVSALVGERAGGHSALFWLGVYIFASALEEVYWTVSPVLATYLRDHGAYRMQGRVLERAAAAPLIQFEDGAFFAHLQRATAGAGERLLRVYNQLTQLASSTFMLGSIAVALYAVQPLLLPLLIIGAAPAVWLQARTATAVYQAQRQHTRRDRVRAHLQALLTGRDAAAEVRLFGSAGYLLTRWQQLRQERSDDIVGAERRRAWSGTIGGTCAGAAYAAGLILVAVLILRGQLTIGNYVTVATGSLWFEGMFGGLITGARALEEDSQFLGDLFDFWRVAGGTGAGEYGGAGVGGHGSSGESSRIPHSPTPALRHSRAAILVEAQGVSFAYPGSAQPVLRDISLRLEPGERIAIVGENGAGKTTLVRLLCGLYQPDRGVVRLDGSPLTPERAAQARRRVAAVFQDYACFQLTARENIGFGNLARLDDDGALRAAAERAGIADLLARLPGGFDAYLGREFGEMEVSGGQWQRLALARAFFRDAGLLVLDEPTAALDPLAELALFQRFAELVKGHTAIMISHRLGMARLADRVLVLEHGAIVEEGPHDALIAAGGLYARMFEAQAQWYR